MIGFWNKSVYITYFSAFISIVGLLLSIKLGNINYAFIGMIVASVCDMFDGKIARKLKERSETEKDFGVEIDSLADIIAFIVVPALTLYLYGMNEIYHIIILALYCVCGVIRLAYFNVAMSDKNKAIEFYTGLPVPVSVLIFGLVWLIEKIVNFDPVLIYTILVPITGYLHISKIRIKKFTGNWYYVTVTILALIGVILGIFILK